MSAILRERSVRLEEAVFNAGGGVQGSGGSFWVRQRSDDGQAIISAKVSRRQGIELGGVSVFRLDEASHFRDRIEAKSAVLEAGIGAWMGPGSMPAARRRRSSTPIVQDQPHARAGSRKLCDAGNRTILATFAYIQLAENAGLAAAAYRLQYYQLWRSRSILPRWCCWRPRSACASSALAAYRRWSWAASPEAFFLTSWQDHRRFEQGRPDPPLAAAVLPALFGGVTGLVTLLYQEDG